MTAKRYTAKYHNTLVLNKLLCYYDSCLLLLQKTKRGKPRYGLIVENYIAKLLLQDVIRFRRQPFLFSAFAYQQ
jgi:hypothetical protein